MSIESDGEGKDEGRTNLALGLGGAGLLIGLAAVGLTLRRST